MSLKSELKNGAVVELRNGRRFIKIDNTFVNELLGITMDGYNEDLTVKSNMRTWDIVKINNNVYNDGCCDGALLEVKYENKWTWERPKEILDKVEKEYLSAVIKPFRDKVKYIGRACSCRGEYRIYIYLINDFMNFPRFKSNKMYKNMKVNKLYTLKELGL